MSSFRKPITLRRVSSGAIDENGRPAAETETPFEVLATVQPATGKQMEAAPEGRRARGGYTLYTSTLLRGVETNNPDRVLLFGQECEVFSVKPWQNLSSLAHFEALVLKREAI